MWSCPICTFTCPVCQCDPSDGAEPRTQGQWQAVVADRLESARIRDTSLDTCVAHWGEQRTRRQRRAALYRRLVPYIGQAGHKPLPRDRELAAFVSMMWDDESKGDPWERPIHIRLK